MGGGGGGSSTSSVTMNGTEEYIYRNSSTKRGGFKGNIGYTDTSTDLDIAGAEDIARTQEILLAADRQLLRDNIATLTNCVLPIFCDQASDLRSKAETAWDRALTLYPDTKLQIDAEMLAIKEDTINRICMREAQWARTSGSSLNCVVQGMKNRAEIELARELAGVIASRLIEHKQHETQAIAQAFEANMSAKLKPAELAFNQIGTLYGLLRGGLVTDTTDRDYSENRDEDTHTLQALGEFYHEATAIADNSGTYESDASDAFAASQAIAGVVGG